MAQIALIIPYFGSFPEWMDLYLYSCSRNRIIDFHYFTDCDIPSKIYKNTIFHSISFRDYCRLVSNRLTIDFHPEDAYKLTDLKPFYGLIHQQELGEYEFWGYGDLDLVYGNLLFFLNEKNLKNYDFLTTHSNRVAGHFSIIRYNSQYTKTCLKLKNWKLSLESERHFSLDEDYMAFLLNPLQRVFCHFYYRYIRKICPDVYKSFDIFQQLTSFLHPRVLMKELYTSPVPRVGEIWKYNVENGNIEVPNRLKGQVKEMFYLHFLNSLLSR
jgi:hypothetical protein